METVALLVVALLMPTGAAYAVVVSRRLRARHERRRPPLPAAPVERIHRDLQRLHDLLEQAENAPSDSPAKYQRSVAVRAAYLDALTDACRHFDLPLPEGRPVPRTEINRVESDLRMRGLDVRPVAQA